MGNFFEDTGTTWGLITRPRMGPSLGFVTDVFFFSVDLRYILWSLSPSDLYFAIVGGLIAPLELYCASVSQYYLSFKLSGKVVFFHLFCHLSVYFFAPAAFIVELHRCSKGRSISRVQTENCYYFRNGFCSRRVRRGGGGGGGGVSPWARTIFLTSLGDKL